MGEQPLTMWIDTHCHLDAAEFDQDRAAVHLRTRAAGVVACVIPSVAAANFDTVRILAHAQHDAYALGIHPLFTPSATETDLAQLDAALHTHRHDTRLVAVGEIGLDGFVPELNTPEALSKQQQFYKAQLKIAQQHQLPVILHVRRSANWLLKGLRDTPVAGGIAHAFNGSVQQAQAFIALGFKLGFGGALTYARSLQLRRLATELPLSALVLETDAPDMPAHWLYTTAEQRRTGQAQGRNEPAELPRIAQVLAELRGISEDELAAVTSANARLALPRLQ
ncbi:TatD family hydrolase [Limnohabitans sp.]|uniref:TatD family hydrolase n=1 Tax=Limnohabitans sp. TaxID=1907725 RepID=UPI00286F464C|nr:TatD family hydrolase [Limnohabitans sp.]